MRGPLAFVALVAFGGLAGCIRSHLVPCGDQVCPSDLVCHVPTQTCEPQLAIDACAAKVENEACSFEGVSEGLCDHGRCRDARCGDGIVDAVRDEICDDGNVDNGDMCSSDCRSLEDCGNGIVDVAAGEQCDDGNRISGDGCQASCVLPFCGDAIVDATLNEACDEGTDNANTSDACRLNCQLPRCGDDVQDLLLGEVCDDGNLVPGDGCRPDCLSNETCGNGIVDFATGEICDDGNRRASDGCSGCLYEQLQSRVFGETPPARTNAAVAYDAARERVVLFGGQVGGARTNDTGEWDGTSWRARQPIAMPQGRTAHAMAYDAARQRVVLFGGSGGGGALDDTWEWDGVNWTKLAPAQKPPARGGAVMAYDAVRERVVLHGGLIGGDTTTWEWDGTTWAATADGPLTVAGAMAYDPLLRVMVLWTGQSGQTWTYNGTTWQQRSPSTPPAGQSGLAMAFDAARGHIVMTGPSAWEWDGTNWTVVGAMTSRSLHVMSYDAARASLVVYGGRTPGFVVLADTWRRDATWTDVTVPLQPPARIHGAVAYDPVRDRAVLFGGRDDSSVVLDDTWEWDGLRWSQRITTQQPSPRDNHTMVFDGTRVLLAGGREEENATVFGDVWTWNGATWAPTTASTALWGRAIVHDTGRNRLVWFGGNAVIAGNDHVDGTFDGADGANPIAFDVPISRHHHAMAYDPVRARVVMYGGNLDVTTFDDSTWELDAQDTWHEISSNGEPLARRGHALVFDPRRRRVVMFGDSVVSPARADVWEWTGAAWLEQVVVPAVASRVRAATTMQASTGELVVFGGRRGFTSIAETTLIGYAPNVVTESCTAATIDYDRDGLYGCDDDDCALRCAPLCELGTSCTAGPHCGDGTCDPAETCRLCPSDCGTCTSTCGDFFCDPPEDATSCPADC
jgi:cysteine-rich repeat protein